MHDFARSERLPSYFMNRIQDFLSGARTEFNLQLKDAVTVRVVPTTLAEEICCICIQGRWRFRETAVERVHPGGAAGTYDVWAVATDQKVVEAPKPFTDETDYSFDLRITPAGTPPSGASVDIWEKVGELSWNGAAITALAQTLGAITGAQIAFGALSTSSQSDLLWGREQSGSWAASYKPDSVDQEALANNSVDTAAIIDLAVTTAKHAALSITEGKLAANSVSTAKIIDLAVTAAKLAAEAVTAEKIGALAVVESKLGPEAVSEAKIKALAVATAKLAAKAVTTEKLGDLAVTAAKVAEAAITEVKIADRAVTSRKFRPTKGVDQMGSLALNGGYQTAGSSEFNCAVTSDVLIWAKFSVSLNSGGTNFDGTIRVDGGAEQGGSAFAYYSGTGSITIPAFGIWELNNLAAGNHKVDMRCRVTSGSGDIRNSETKLGYMITGS